MAGGPDLSMHEVQEAAEVITASADPSAKIIFGTIIDESLGDQIKITVIATGFKNLRDRRSNDEEEESAAYRPAKTIFTPTMEEKKIFTKPKIDVEKEEPLEEYKELDIPRFIRNKMKK